MIFETESAQNFLQEEFKRRVRLNHRYSLRAYARNLGLSSGALSEILRHQRPITLKMASKIAKSLGLSTVEKKRLYDLIGSQKQETLDHETSSALTLTDHQQQKLDEDTFHLVSEWQHFAILNLIDCENFRWNAAHVAKRLGLTATQAQLAMNLLIRLGLVCKKGDTYKGVRDYVLSPTGITSTAIRNYHRQMMNKAIEAIEFQDTNEREFSGVGFAMDPSRLPQIKQEISAFQDQLAAKYSKGKKQEVYFLEMALFKLSQGDNNEKN